MKRTPKLKICSFCGQPFIPEGRGRRTCSFECSVKIMKEQIQALREKNGPLYERWLKGMRKATEEWERKVDASGKV